MAASKLTARRINAFLEHLEALVHSLPTQEQKQEIDRELERVIAFLTDFKARLATLPTCDEEKGLEESLKVLRHFVAIAEADPLISRTLRLKAKESRARSSTRRAKSPENIPALVDELKASSPANIRRALDQKTAGCTVADLRQIATAMGVRVHSKMSRAAIVDQIVKRAEIQAGYDYLRDRA